MNRSQLEHIIRAAAGNADAADIVVIGSQAILASFPNAPDELTGEECAQLTFEELHRRICEAWRGNRAPMIAEMLLPDGGHKIIRGRK